ncbi:uncharacterized protein [Montipora capricornis]|uniref:uncharacterized protein n=1 Tax=Montipora capricornis TaxID=246305 RepID=UPI0035F19687
MTSEVVQESEGKSFTTRLCELPVAVAAIQQLSQIYTSVKERNAVTRYACSAGESTINMANSATQPILTAANSLPLAQPILGKIECAAATIDRVASGTLTKVEEKLPFITKTPNEIKTALSQTASTYYSKVQNAPVVKMVIAKTGEMVSFTEVLSELALPTDGSCPEDVKELVTMAEDQSKGSLARIRNLQKRIARRGTKKLLSYKSVQFTVEKVGDLQGRVTDLVGVSATAGKKLFNATMYIPSMALELSGEVFVSAKNLVFAFTKAHSVSDMPAAVASVVMNVTEPLSKAKDQLVGYVFVNQHVMTQYLLSSAPVQWMLPHVVAVEDIAEMSITVAERAESEELEDDESEEETDEEDEEEEEAA